MKKLCILLASCVFAMSAQARDPKQVDRFIAANPCPIKTLPGHQCFDGTTQYVVDHSVPLCAGGADTPDNMRWQEYQESLKKDVQERYVCRMLRTWRATP